MQLYPLCETSLTIRFYLSPFLSAFLREIYALCISRHTIPTHSVLSTTENGFLPANKSRRCKREREIRLGFRERRQGKSRWVGRTSGKASRRSSASIVSQCIVQMWHRKRSAWEKDRRGEGEERKERGSKKIRWSWTIHKLSTRLTIRHGTFAANGKRGRRESFSLVTWIKEEILHLWWSIASHEWREISRRELLSAVNETAQSANLTLIDCRNWARLNRTCVIWIYCLLTFLII